MALTCSADSPTTKKQQKFAQFHHGYHANGVHKILLAINSKTDNKFCLSKCAGIKEYNDKKF